MKAFVHPPFPVTPPARSRRGAFALVLTLLILSLLVVVAVSYLSSMVGERQTADAYTSKARAEQIAQAGADSAMAILKESFRDFPDSATVWDTAQSLNADGTPNEGTSLYLRAVPDGSNEANPFPAGTPSAANPIAANAALGNDPSNPNCKNFVLPLISGVPSGRAQLVSNKANIFTAKMNYTVTDPTTQNCTDLNVRRGSGDIQGVIGSPPGWTGSAANVGSTPAPKPARAYWVPLKSKVKDASGNTVDGPVTGRYAFWIEDESFRANDSYFNKGSYPQDNSMQFKDGSGNPRSIGPGDPMLLGPLTLANDTSAPDDAAAIFDARQRYPGGFFPDPLAFAHTFADGTSSFSTSQTDLLRYLLTNQSGTLNLTRHGTQRLNLNDVLSAATPQKQIDQIVQTIKFHLPYFGQRFYRSSPTNLSVSALNDATQVPGSPIPNQALTVAQPPTHSNIYNYKIAANILDYMDADSQPTLIDTAGHVLGSAPPTAPLNADPGSNQLWAQGKEIAPYIQEVAVRYQPVVYDHGPHPPLKFDMQIDYYVELWNMSDRDIYAGTSSAPNLGGATLHICDQHTWNYYPGSDPVAGAGGSLVGNDGKPSILTTMGPTTDYEIDLTNNVFLKGSSTATSGGVVFKAGSCTVITTDPGYMNYIFQGPPISGSTTMASLCPPIGIKPSFNPETTFYCKNLIHGMRDYQGTVNAPAAAKGPGIQSVFRGGSEDAELQVFLGNSRGIIDSVPCALTEYGSSQYTNTDSEVGTPGKYNDYSYSSCLFGNYNDSSKLYYSPIASEMGDPRTNNEQLTITAAYDTSLKGDQSRFVYPKGTTASPADTTLGYPNGASQQPDKGSYPWPDYYVLPTQQGAVPYPAPDATNSPMVIADSPLVSIGQLGDVFDPARLPAAAGTGGTIVNSRGGGRTLKIGQHDDRYSYDPTGSANFTNAMDTIPASNGWAAWRLTDVFDAADASKEAIETPACININGVPRDQGAALQSLLYGFDFQPKTTSDWTIHGDNHGSAGIAGQALSGYPALVSQINTRLSNLDPTKGPSGPFFERGELGELGIGANAIFGLNPSTQYAATNKLLVNSVDMNKTFDHSREEVLRRIAQMICTRGDTFTVYAVGQSILQPTASSPTASFKVTGTHRLRLTFRLVPKNLDGTDFHPGYTVDPQTGVPTATLNTNPNYADLSDTSAKGRFARPDHYDVQILQTATY